MCKKVLIVDDNPDIVAVNEEVVRECGHKALTALNGEEALSQMDEKPDLIILDVLMPRKSGIRLYQELKSDLKLQEIPIVILSGIAKQTFLRSQKGLAEFSWAKLPEPEIYLEKPVEPDELAIVLNRLLG